MEDFEIKYETVKEDLIKRGSIFLQQHTDAEERGNSEMASYYLGCYETVKEIYEEYFS